MPEDFKVVVILLLGGIVVSLGKALFHMSSGPNQSGEMVTSLMWRVGLSVALFVILMAGAYLHLISPHGAP
ncbi:MAG TPA: twin transmembrane helix small protein [Steroidobacteraceae bacterium]|nr:twin transmembrane helix small protein [Steroidobacteraceae bacterium]